MKQNQFKQILLPGQELNIKSLIQEEDTSDVKLSKQFKIMPDKNLIVKSQIGGKLFLKQVKENLLVVATNRTLRVNLAQIITNYFQYYPEVDDQVIGIVKQKLGDNYIIDINSITDCYLSIYNFPGATKRNYPILQPGALVFCKVETIPKYLSPQLTCLSSTSTKHFSTNQNEFGELKNGVICQSQLITTMEEMDTICQIANKIIDKIEIAVGKNYRIWLEGKGKNSREALVGIKGVLESGEDLNNMINKMDKIKRLLLAMKE